MSTSPGVAPMDMRMPISRVRSVTETSMMFMMPMPPTSSDNRRDDGDQHFQGARDDAGQLRHLLNAGNVEVVLAVLDAALFA